MTGEEGLDPAQLPVTEAGGGVAEGFEESERALIEHASHGDQQSAHTILHDQGRPRRRASSARIRSQTTSAAASSMTGEREDARR